MLKNLPEVVASHEPEAVDAVTSDPSAANTNSESQTMNFDDYLDVLEKDAGYGSGGSVEDVDDCQLPADFDEFLSLLKT